ncbi:MAG: RsmG family class I SAM-dependent methyltransferase [Acidobacteriota bacterium]
MSLSTELSPESAALNVREAALSAPYFRGRVLDVGSGGGYPIVSVAILRPDLDICLCERRTRRAAYLQYLLAELGLRRVAVEAAEARTLATGWGTVSARAVPVPGRFLEWATRIVAASGRLILYVGSESAAAMRPSLETFHVKHDFHLVPGMRSRGFLVADVGAGE